MFHLVGNDDATRATAEQQTVGIGEYGTCRNGTGAAVNYTADALYLPREKQNGDLATYAAKIEREDAKIDFTRPASELDLQIRALTPIPYAYFTRSDGATVKVLSARPAKGEGTPGTVLAASLEKEGYIRVACGAGALDIVSLKPEGKGGMTAADYLRGRKLSVGEAL